MASFIPSRFRGGLRKTKSTSATSMPPGQRASLADSLNREERRRASSIDPLRARISVTRDDIATDRASFDSLDTRRRRSMTPPPAADAFASGGAHPGEIRARARGLRAEISDFTAKLEVEWGHTPSRNG